MRKKLLISIILIISIIIIFFILKNETIQRIDYDIKKRLYGDPIDTQSGLINNEFFFINSEGKNAQQTTKGINEAIIYANKNNIENIKLEKGTYLISGEVDDKKNSYKKKGIILQSNINMDLNRLSINTRNK